MNGFWIVRNRVAAILGLLVVISSVVFPLRAGIGEVELCGVSLADEDEPNDGLRAMLYYLLLMARAFSGTTLRSQPLAAPFEPNLGQFPDSIQFASASAGWSFATDRTGKAELRIQTGKGTFESIRLGLDNANPRAIGLGEEQLSGRVNYILGRDPSKWTTGVPQFAKVRYRNVYPGIDEVHSFHGGRIETDFEVQPGGDTNRIRVRLEGVKGLTIDAKDGSLVMHSPGGHEVRWGQTRIFQRSTAPGGRSAKRTVAGKIRILSADTVGFEVGEYDRSQTLVIDPVLNYLSYVGRNGSDGLTRAATDANGNLYAVGATSDVSYPVSAGAVPPSSVPTIGRPNATLVKLNADGSQMVYTTHFGGTDVDVATAISLDAAGNIYVVGATNSPDYPVSQNAYHRTIAQGDRLACFLTKFNPAGSAIVYSTYFNGSGVDGCSGVAVDGSGSIFVAGITTSPNLPVTPDALQTSFRSGGGDAIRGFVAKFNNTGTSLIYSTFLGGSGRDTIFALAVDAAGAAYVAGTTSSGNFPVTAGAAQTAFGGAGGILDFSGGDAFAAKISPDGSKLVYSTYIGGRNDDFANGIAVGKDGSAYVTGSTLSTNFPVTGSAVQATYAGAGGGQVAGGDGFLVKINPAGSAFTYATYLGGSKDEHATSVVVDDDGNAWVGGLTLSENLPVTADAAQKQFGGAAIDMFNAGDGFVVQVNADGSKILYSTYVGGAAGDYISALALSRDGKSVLFAGGTASRNLAVTPDAAQRQGGTGEPNFAPFGDGMAGRLGIASAIEVTVSQVASSASFAGGVISPGMVLAIDGAGFRTGDGITGTPGADGTYPKTLGGVQVSINGIDAPLVSISATRIVAIAPYGLDGVESAEVVVRNQGSASAPVTVAVVPVQPGIFTVDGSGVGSAVAFNEDGNANSADAPALAGTEVTVLATGEGQTDPAGVDGLPATSDTLPVPLAGPVVIRVGDTEVELLSASVMRGYPAGYFAIRFRMPADLPPGPVSITLQVGEAVSQAGVVIFVTNP